MIEKNCLLCGNIFFTYPSKIKIGKGKYCSKRCCLEAVGIKPGQRLSPDTEIKPGQRTSRYKGWRIAISRKNGKPYRQLFLPDHPMADSRGYVREHRYVMSKHLGRNLRDSEIVHHIDGNTLNNSVTNLQVMDKKEHDRMNINLNIHKRWIERR